MEKRRICVAEVAQTSGFVRSALRSTRTQLQKVLHGVAFAGCFRVTQRAKRFGISDHTESLGDFRYNLWLTTERERSLTRERM